MSAAGAGAGVPGADAPVAGDALGRARDDVEGAGVDAGVPGAVSPGVGPSASGADGGRLVVVGTPIGNLGDLSPRALDALRDASLVLCEDTRVTGRLLARFGVKVRTERADENVLDRKIRGVLERIAAGERVAYVSDAGMPGVSDPGQRLVDAAREAGLAVEVIPGPSAAICALVASGLPMARFYFEGFLPRKSGARVERLRVLAAIPGTLVVYESPHRVPATLADIAQVMPGRRVALARELTKLHEEVLRGSAEELAETLARRDALKGECVLVVAPPSDDEADAFSTEKDVPLEVAIAQGVEAGEPKSALAKRLAKAYGLPRSAVYEQVVRGG